MTLLEVAPPPVTTSHTILIVEDDRAIAEFLDLLLASEGYEVAVAAGGAQARQLAAARRPSLAIVDLRLGADSGWQVAADLAAMLGDDLPTLMISADQLAIMGEDARGRDVLAKPFDIDELLARVARALRASKVSADDRSPPAKG